MRRNLVEFLPVSQSLVFGHRAREKVVDDALRSNLLRRQRKDEGGT